MQSRPPLSVTTASSPCPHLHPPPFPTHSPHCLQPMDPPPCGAHPQGAQEQVQNSNRPWRMGRTHTLTLQPHCKPSLLSPQYVLELSFHSSNSRTFLPQSLWTCSRLSLACSPSPLWWPASGETSALSYFLQGCLPRPTKWVTIPLL